MMLRFVLFLCVGTVSVCAFVQPTSSSIITTPSLCVLASKKDDSDVSQQHAFAAGTFVEFQEKKRVHVGKIDAVEHKSNGGAMYKIIDNEGKKYNGVADKAVLYSMACPNSPGQATKLWEEFCLAQDSPVATLQEKLDIGPELLEMAWEEAADESQEDHMLTADSLIELVHSHEATAMERYYAWKFLKTGIAHVFFKEIKDHGRVVAFKAKTKKSVEAAKATFCHDNPGSEICFV